jgi:hypothetical protein
VGGSDWVTIRIRDVATGETLPDVVPWVKFSNITWTLDNKGFFYSRYPAVEGVGVGGDASKHAGTEVNKNEYHMLYYHVVGTPAESDVCVFEDKSELSHNGNVLLISVSGVGGAALVASVFSLWFVCACACSEIQWVRPMQSRVLLAPGRHIHRVSKVPNHRQAARCPHD